MTLGKSEQAEFMFLLTATSQISEPLRRFILSERDFSLLNPNTRTCPVFRTKTDAELTKNIHARVPVLVSQQNNPWDARFARVFDMTNDSRDGYFKDAPAKGRVPLYEAKLMWQYDHRFSTYEGATEANVNEGNLPQTSPIQKGDPFFTVLPHNWVDTHEVETRCGNWKHSWFLAFRDTANSASERTAIFSILPRVGVGNKAPLVYIGEQFIDKCPCLLANMNALCFDYCTRQKVGGATLNFFLVKQFPVLPPFAFTHSDMTFVTSRVLELVYTAWDIKPFAEDMGYDGPPFVWEEDRRAVLRADLDAYYARLYGLTRKQLRYILDPNGLSTRELEDILDPWEDPTCSGPHLLPENLSQDFPGETFRILKQNEERPVEKGGYGEYRTRRLVLEAWARLEAELGPAKPMNYHDMLEQQALLPAETSVPIVQEEPEVLVLVAPDHTPQQKLSFDAPTPATAEPQQAVSGELVLVNGWPARLIAREVKNGVEQVTVQFDGDTEPKKFLSPPAVVEACP
jgi:hypothetical protein